jgi:Ser/Thr protein kinase RdoA (MazF antagonist)
MAELGRTRSGMTARDALRIAARFGIEGAAARELPGGWVNDNWLVEGRDKSKFVVRRYGRMNVTWRALIFEHDVMRHAASRVPEVRAPLADADGETLLRDDGAFNSLFPYVEGITGDRSIAPGAAAVLARFHAALDDFQAARRPRRRTVVVLARLRDQFSRLAAQPILAHKLPWDDVDAALARAMARVLRYADRLPLATVHGDPHPDNFVVDDGHLAGVLDFDFSHKTERAYDVGSAMDAFARQDEDAALDLAAAAGFARAYHAVAPLSTEEWGLLPDFMLRRNAFLIWYVVIRHGRRAFGDIGNADRYARRVLELDKMAGAWETAEWRGS